MDSSSSLREEIKSKVKDGHEIEFSILDEAGRRKKHTARVVGWVDRPDDDNGEPHEKLHIEYPSGLEGYVDPDVAEMKLLKCSEEPLSEEDKAAKYKPLIPKGGDEKGRKLEGQELVNKRVKVWWPDESQYFEGEVRAYEESQDKHVLHYDDGEEDKVVLKEEVWELVGEAVKKAKGSKRKAEPKKEEGSAAKKSKTSGKKASAGGSGGKAGAAKAATEDRSLPIYANPVVLVKTPQYQIWQHAGSPVRYSLYFKVAEGLQPSDVSVRCTRAHIQVEALVNVASTAPAKPAAIAAAAAPIKEGGEGTENGTGPSTAAAPMPEATPAAQDAGTTAETDAMDVDKPAENASVEPAPGKDAAPPADQPAGDKHVTDKPVPDKPATDKPAAETSNADGKGSAAEVKQEANTSKPDSGSDAAADGAQPPPADAAAAAATVPAEAAAGKSAPASVEPGASGGAGGANADTGSSVVRKTFVVIIPHPCVDSSKTTCELTNTGQLYIRLHLDPKLLPPSTS